MATIRELIPYSSGLTLLYVDESQEFLMAAVNVLKQAFARVDDAHNATSGIGFAKINKYDLMVIDSSSSIMSATQLVKNVKEINKYQNLLTPPLFWTRYYTSLRKFFKRENILKRKWKL